MIGFCAAAQLCAAQVSGRAVSAVPLVELLNQVQMHLTHSQMEMHQLPFDILVYSNTQSTDVMEITISAVCNAQLVIIPQKEKVVHMSTARKCTCAFEHGCVRVHIYVLGWWRCNKGEVCSGKEATRHLT